MDSLVEAQNGFEASYRGYVTLPKRQQATQFASRSCL